MAPSFDEENSLFKFVVTDGNGVKGLVDSGIAKVPERYIQPPGNRFEKIIGGTKGNYASVPIDLSKLDGPDHDQVVDDIVRAAETLGFFQVINHGVDLDILESVKDAAHRFFEQPTEAKAAYRKEVSPSPVVEYGTSFAPEKERALEWKDYIRIGYINDADAEKNWPKVCKEETLDYIKSSSKLVKRLLEMLINNLGVKIEESRLETLMGYKAVALNYYPACPNPDLTVGVGPHSDLGIITVLLQDGIGGLYVKVEEDIASGRKEEWIEIPPIPGALVVNAGDVLQIISNGKYKSAEHRVRTTSKQSRVSVPLFTLPPPTVKIAPFPEVVECDGGALYREVLIKDYTNHFFGHAHQGKKALDFAKINFPN